MDINSYLEGFRDGYEKAVRTARPIGLIEDAMRKQLQRAARGKINVPTPSVSSVSPEEILAAFSQGKE